jgi:hypothetical protein
VQLGWGVARAARVPKADSMATTTAEVITATGIFCIAMVFIHMYIKTIHKSHFWVPQMVFVYTFYILENIAMQTILMLVMLVGASIAAGASSWSSIVSLNVTQVAYARSNCGAAEFGSGNTHCQDPDVSNPRTNPQWNIVGNRHDFDGGFMNANPYVSTR